VSTLKKRFWWHLSIPVCETLRGTKTHLEYITIKDLRLICNCLNCSVNEVGSKFWTSCKASRGKCKVMNNAYEHQIDALTRATNGNLALFHDCGTGKTFTALHIINYWKAKGEGPALVVCPLSIIEAAWIEDCKKFTPGLSIVSLHDTRLIVRQKRLQEKHDIYVANYETFKSLYPALAAKGFRTLIVDESSKMKNPKSQITRALLSFAGIEFRKSPYKAGVVIPHRYVLSGTPAPNNEGEYWAQIKLCSGPGNEYLHDNFYAFRSMFFQTIPLGLTGQKMFKFRSEMRDVLLDAIAPIIHVVRKKDAMDLPEQVHQVRNVELSGPELKAYKTMEKDLVLRLKDETILSTNALVEVMKLRQLTSGFIYGEDTHQVGRSKLDELVDLLDAIGDNQVIIWANFKEEIKLLLKELPGSAALWSETPDRDRVIKGFQNDEFRYLIANPQSAAHGLTFTNCRYAVYYSLNYSYEMLKQSQDRIHRIGQKHSTTYYYLLANNTIDGVIYRALNGKASLSQATLAYLKKGIKVRKIA